MSAILLIGRGAVYFCALLLLVNCGSFESSPLDQSSKNTSGSSNGTLLLTEYEATAPAVPEAEVTISFRKPNLDVTTLTQMGTTDQKSIIDFGSYSCLVGSRIQTRIQFSYLPNPKVDIDFDFQCSLLETLVNSTTQEHICIDDPTFICHEGLNNIHIDGSESFQLNGVEQGREFIIRLIGSQISSIPDCQYDHHPHGGFQSTHEQKNLAFSDEAIRTPHGFNIENESCGGSGSKSIVTFINETIKCDLPNLQASSPEIVLVQSEETTHTSDCQCPKDHKIINDLCQPSAAVEATCSIDGDRLKMTVKGVGDDGQTVNTKNSVFENFHLNIWDKQGEGIDSVYSLNNPLTDYQAFQGQSVTWTFKNPNTNLQDSCSVTFPESPSLNPSPDVLATCYIGNGNLNLMVLNAGPNGETANTVHLGYQNFAPVWNREGQNENIVYSLSRDLSNYAAHSGQTVTWYFRNPDTSKSTSCTINFP